MKPSHQQQPRHCMWPGCSAQGRDQLLDRDTDICTGHAEIIHDHYLAWDKSLDVMRASITAREERDRLAEVETNRARLLAGKLPLPGAQPTEIIYYIQVGDTIKIGYSSNITVRLAKYPPNAVVLGAEFGDKALEHQRHDQFHARLAWGREWFTDCQEIRDHIATLPVLHLDLKRARARRGPANQAQTMQPPAYLRGIHLG